MNDRRNIWMPLSGLLAVVALSALDNFIVNPALPLIVGEFGGLAHLSWVLTAFMLASTITMPLYGKLSDIYGRRALFTISIVIFLIGSALCGASRSMTQLIIFRSLQGLGAGGTGVLAITSLGDIVSPRERPRYQGLFNAVMTLSCIAGPVIGGVVTSALGWRWVFYINLPIGFCALALIWSTLSGKEAAVRDHKIDYVGVVLLAIGTISFLMLLQTAEHAEQLMSPRAGVMAVLMVAAFALLVPHERRAVEPILAFYLLKNRVFLFTVVASATIGLAFFGSSVFFPLYFQIVGGHTPAQSGLMLLPQLVAGTIASLVGGQFVSRTGLYKPFILTGMSLVSVALLLLAGVAHLGLVDGAAIACLMLMGVGGGLCMSNMTVALQNAISSRELGVGTSSLQFCNSIAAVAGVALSGFLLSQRARTHILGKLPKNTLDKVLGEGVRSFSHLGMVEQTMVTDAYRHAFAITFLTSAILTVFALMFATQIPVLKLKDYAPALEPAEPSIIRAEGALI